MGKFDLKQGSQDAPSDVPDNDQPSPDSSSPDNSADSPSPVLAQVDPVSIPSPVQDPNAANPAVSYSADGTPTITSTAAAGPLKTDLQGPTNPVQTAQYLKQQDADWSQDLQNQHITPETYKDLFAKKDTLGKIGTMFGLLVGGVGSGLTGQPNAVIQMMNSQIQNDLDAQKASKANAQNFIRLNQAHQTGEFEKGLQTAQTNNIQAQANTQSDALAHMQANRAALNYVNTKIVQPLIDAASADPTNMDKARRAQSAQQAAGLLSTGIDSSNSNVADQAAAKIGLLGTVNPPTQQQGGVPQSSNNSGVDIQKMNSLIQGGKLGVPTAITPGEVGAVNQEAQKVQDNRAVTNMYADSFKNLDRQALAGHLTPDARAAELNTLAGSIARATAGRYNAAEAMSQANGMFPQAGDWGSTRKEKFRKAMQYFQSEEAGTPTLDRYGLKTPFPYATSQNNDPMDGKTATGPNGQKVIRKNGQWVPMNGGQ